MATRWTQIAILTIVLTISGPVLGIAQPSQPKSDTYTWNGELVSLDTTAKTITVKSRVAYHEAISEVKHGLAAIKTVKPGEWVTVTARHQPSTEDEAVVAVRPYGANIATE
jgi:hypothetical protein